MRNNLLTRYLLRRNLGAAVLGMAVSTLNTVIDAFLMGNLLGPDALSAINLSMPLSYVLVTVQCILAAGASLRVSKKLGERLNREADAVFTVSVAVPSVVPAFSRPFSSTLTIEGSLLS